MDGDRAVAQAASRWLSTAATLVRTKVNSCGICGEQSGTGGEFLLALRLLSPIIPQIAPHSSSAILQTYRLRVRFSALPDFMSSSGSRTRSTKLREDK
jgi:hypothetical protein